MSVTLRVPTILRPLTDGQSELAVDGVSTLAELMAKVDADHPGIRDRVLDDTGKIRRFVNVYVGEEDVRFAGGLETPTPDGVTVSIIPAVAGG
ncbi:MAG TPA: MoaD/ThiS family protein [Mycobacteriales bacterium]|nr:MoaD/ThiS family protein [Mycobacteriales bacterium]